MAITNALGLELPQGEDNLENGLIDTKMLQELQDQFCYSNNLYVVCLGQAYEGVSFCKGKCFRTCGRTSRWTDG